MMVLAEIVTLFFYISSMFYLKTDFGKFISILYIYIYIMKMKKKKKKT